MPGDAGPLFDEYASDYAQTVNAAIAASGEDSAYFAELKAKLAAEELGPGTKRVLDFGCGVGGSTRALAGVITDSRFTGYDVSAESIRQAQARGGERLAFVSGAEGDSALPFGEGAFDAAFTACVFHHVDRDAHARWARELKRVVAPGGRFVFFEHNPLNPLTRRVVKACPFDEGVILLGPWYAKRLLREAGFEVSGPRFYFFFPHLLRFLRPLERWMRWIPLGGQYYLVARRPLSG